MNAWHGEVRCGASRFARAAAVVGLLCGAVGWGANILTTCTLEAVATGPRAEDATKAVGIIDRFLVLSTDTPEGRPGTRFDASGSYTPPDGEGDEEPPSCTDMYGWVVIPADQAEVIAGGGANDDYLVLRYLPGKDEEIVVTCTYSVDCGEDTGSASDTMSVVVPTWYPDPPIDPTGGQSTGGPSQAPAGQQQQGSPPPDAFLIEYEESGSWTAMPDYFVAVVGSEVRLRVPVAWDTDRRTGAMGPTANPDKQVTALEAYTWSMSEGAQADFVDKQLLEEAGTTYMTVKWRPLSAAHSAVLRVRETDAGQDQTPAREGEGDGNGDGVKDGRRDLEPAFAAEYVHAIAVAITKVGEAGFLGWNGAPENTIGYSLAPAGLSGTATLVLRDSANVDHTLVGAALLSGGEYAWNWNPASAAGVPPGLCSVSLSWEVHVGTEDGCVAGEPAGGEHRTASTSAAVTVLKVDITGAGSMCVGTSHSLAATVTPTVAGSWLWEEASDRLSLSGGTTTPTCSVLAGAAGSDVLMSEEIWATFATGSGVASAAAHRVVVQEPKSLQTLAMTPLEDNPKMVDVLYRVVDQNGAVIAQAGLVPMEYLPDLQGTVAGIPVGPTQVSSAPPGDPLGVATTAADGTFHDSPLGFESNDDYDVTVTQTITMEMAGHLYPVRVNNLHWRSVPPYVTGP